MCVITFWSVFGQFFLTFVVFCVMIPKIDNVSLETWNFSTLSINLIEPPNTLVYEYIYYSYVHWPLLCNKWHIIYIYNVYIIYIYYITLRCTLLNYFVIRERKKVFDFWLRKILNCFAVNGRSETPAPYHGLFFFTRKWSSRQYTGLEKRRRTDRVRRLKNNKQKSPLFIIMICVVIWKFKSRLERHSK